MMVVLVNIRSLHNVGSMFRTADSAGIEKLYLAGYTPAPTDEYGLPRGPLVKVALGAEKSVDWEKVGSTAVLLERLRKEGKKIFAIEQSVRSVPYTRIRLSAREKKNAVLVVGNEVKGLSPAVLKRCHKIVEIPMLGKKESLNVAVAFGVVVYALTLS